MAEAPEGPFPSKLRRDAEMLADYVKNRAWYPPLVKQEKPGATVSLDEIKEVFAFFENGDQEDKEICIMILTQLEHAQLQFTDTGKFNFEIALTKPSTIEAMQFYIEGKKQNFQNFDDFDDL